MNAEVDSLLSKRSTDKNNNNISGERVYSPKVFLEAYQETRASEVPRELRSLRLGHIHSSDQKDQQKDVVVEKVLLIFFVVVDLFQETSEDVIPIPASNPILTSAKSGDRFFVLSATEDSESATELHVKVADRVEMISSLTTGSSEYLSPCKNWVYVKAVTGKSAGKYGWVAGTLLIFLLWLLIFLLLLLLLLLLIFWC